MHELAVAESVLESITSRTADRRVVAVHLEVGRLSGVHAESLKFCFDLAAAGTPVEGAAIDVLESAGRARCRSCAQEFGLDHLILLCPCGSADVLIVAGADLKILSVEVSR